MRRSPLVSRISQALGGSPTSTPRSRTFTARARTNPSANTVRLSIRPVAVRVFQHDDAADRVVLVGPGDVPHEAGHLDRPQAPVEIPVDRDRLLDQRLGGDELDAVAGRHVERLQRFLG